MNQRSFITIAGPDRTAFLQGLLTQDVTKLETIQFAAMLSPQGKILHDMFLVAQADAILLDTPRIHAAVLLKRLAMYKLRAKVTIADASDQWQVSLGDDGFPDPRHAELPRRAYTCHPEQREGSHYQRGILRVAQEDTLRTTPLSLGIPDSATDFAPDTITAMDAGYDLLNAISFSKGCYVGQEVTARMHYKSIARKGFFLVEAEQPLHPGAALMIGGKPVDHLRSASGTTALVFLKFEDALSEAEKTVDNFPVRVTAPAWMQPKIAQFTANHAAQ